MIATCLSLQDLANIGQIVAGGASILVFVSVLLVWKQVHQQAQDGRVALTTGMTDLISSVSRTFIEYPTMRKYFYEGATPVKTGCEYERAQAIAAMMADAFDHVAAHLGLMEEPAQNAWRAYCKCIYEKSPILREHLEAHAGWYRSDLQEQLDIDK